jgi:hypothetical protein
MTGGIPLKLPRFRGSLRGLVVEDGLLDSIGCEPSLEEEVWQDTARPVELVLGIRLTDHRGALVPNRLDHARCHVNAPGSAICRGK